MLRILASWRTKTNTSRCSSDQRGCPILAFLAREGTTDQSPEGICREGDSRVWEMTAKPVVPGLRRVQTATDGAASVAAQTWASSQIQIQVTDVQWRLLGSSRRKRRLASVFTLDFGKLCQISKVLPFLREVLMSTTDEKFYRPRITQRVDFAPDLWMIRINPGGEFKFAPGQYATLGVEEPPKRSERPYSIVSSPYENELPFSFYPLPALDLPPHLSNL